MAHASACVRDCEVGVMSTRYIQLYEKPKLWMLGGLWRCASLQRWNGWDCVVNARGSTPLEAYEWWLYEKSLAQIPNVCQDGPA